MFRSYWLAAIALGLIFFGHSSVQANENQTKADGREEASQYQRLPVPLPVQVIEKDSEREARHRREQNAEQREIDDLLAQQSMEKSNRRMVDLSDQQTWLVFLGTIGLFVTIGLTYFANRAAWAAVFATRDIGEKQVRAYLSCERGEYRSRAAFLDCRAIFKNYGQSPAQNIEVDFSLVFRQFGDLGQIENCEIKGFPQIGSMPIIAPGAIERIPLYIPWEKIEEMDFLFRDTVGREAVWFRIRGKLSWMDVFGKSQKIEFQLTPQSVPGILGFGRMSADNAEAYTDEADA